MPSRNWDRNREQNLGDFPSSGNLGNGGDKHIPLGTNSEGVDFRDCLRFIPDWTGMARIVSATLTLTTTTSNNHIQKSSSTVTVWNLASSFDEAGGGENYWQAKGTVYPGPNRNTPQTKSVGSGGGVAHSFDVTEIIDRWAPSSVIQSDGVTPGGGESRYGFGLSSDLRSEFQSIRGNQKPTLTVVYDDSVAPTVDLISPTDDADSWVQAAGVDEPTELMRARLSWSVTLGPTDTALTAHSWTLSEGVTPIDSGTAPLEPGTFAVETVPLTPGATYELQVSAEGDGGGGATIRTVSFVFPVGESVHSVALGLDPSSLGATFLPTTGLLDVLAVAYALSSDGSELGIATDWADTPPDPPAGSWWLLIRCRLYRSDPRTATIAEGVDRVDVNWRGALTA